MFSSAMYLASCSLIDDYKYGRIDAIQSLRTILVKDNKERRNAVLLEKQQSCQVEEFKKLDYRDCNPKVSELSVFPEAKRVESIKLDRILKKFKVTFGEVDVSLGSLFDWSDDYWVDNSGHYEPDVQPPIEEARGVVYQTSRKVKQRKRVLEYEDEKDWYFPVPRVDVVERMVKPVLDILVNTGTPLSAQLAQAIVWARTKKKIFSTHFGDYFEDCLRLKQSKAEAQIFSTGLVTKAEETLTNIDQCVGKVTDQVGDLTNKADVALTSTTANVNEAIDKISAVTEHTMTKVGVATTDAATTVTKVGEAAEKTLVSAEKAVEETSAVAKVLKSAMDTVKSVFGSVVKNFHILPLILGNFFHLLIAPTAQALAFCALSTINTILMLYFGVSLPVVAGITIFTGLVHAYYLVDYNCKKKEKAGAQMGVDMLNDYGLEMARMLKMDMSHVVKLASIAKNVFIESGKIAQSGNQISRFIRDHLTYFEQAMYYVSSKCYNNNKLLNTFANLEGRQALQTFVRTVEILTDPINRTKVLFDPFWTTLIYRTKALSVVISCSLLEEADKRAVSVLAPYVKRLDELFNEVRHNKVNSPAGYEPYYFYMYGATGIGKSHSVDGIIIDMLKSAGVKYNSDPVYTRAPGLPYWNCLNGEPACKYDDFLQIKDDVTSPGEIYALKTAAKFNPPIAKMEDKHTIYNPMIVACCANVAFPTAHVVCPKSFFARRNKLIKCVYKKKSKDADRIGMDTYTNAELDEFQHLRFQVHRDPAAQDVEPGPEMTYNELMDELRTEFRQYTIKEETNFNKRMKRYSVLADPNVDTDQLSYMLDQASASLTTGVNAIKKVVNIPIKERELVPYNVSYVQALEDTKKLKDKATAQMDVQDIVGALTPEPQEEVEEDITNLFGSLGSEALNVAQLDKIVEPKNDYLFSSDTKRVVPGIEPHDVTIAEPFHFPVRCNVDLSAPSVLDARGQPSCIPYCLHEIKSDDSCQLIYDSDKNVVYKGILQIPVKPCKYDDGKGKQHELSSCVLVTKKTKEQYFADLNIKATQFYEGLGSTKYTPFDDKGSREGKAVWYFTETMKRILGDLKEATAKIEVRFENSKGLRMIKKVYVQVGQVKNAIVKKILSVWAEWSKVIMAVSLGLVCMFGTKFVSMFSWFGKKGIPQGSGAGKTYDVGRTFKEKVQKIRYSQNITQNDDGVSASAQSVLMKEQTYPIVNNVLGNMFFLDFQGGSVSYQGRCLGVYQHHAIMPYHYAEAFINALKESDGSFSVMNSKGVKQFLTDVSFLNTVERIVDASGKDTGLCRFEAPKAIGLFKDIRSYIFSGQTELPANCIFASMLSNGAGNTREVQHLPLTHNYEVEVEDGVGYSAWKVSNGFAYPKQHKGLCGSVILAEFRCGVKIIGMHTAGLTRANMGVAEPLFSKYFGAPKDDAPVAMEDFTPFELEPVEKARCQIDTFVSKLACVPRSKRTAQSRKSQLTPSLISGVYPVITGPAVLDPNDPRLDKSLHEQGFIDPMFCGSRKRGFMAIGFNSRMLALSIESLRTKILAEVKPLRMNVGKLSIPQAVNGMNLVGYDRMDLTTSEGYPWILSRPHGVTSKKWMFQLDDRETVVQIFNPLQERVRQANKMREQLVVPYTIYNCCLKDEKKSLEKIPIPGKTRVFELSPVDATISHRMYTQDFVASYANTRFAAEHAIGIDVDSNDWALLYNKLVEFSPYIVYADYSDFGPTLDFGCVLGAFKIIDDWFEHNGEQDHESNSAARKCMAYEVGQCREICNDLLFQAHCGLPSGCTLTTYLNSLVNCIYIRYMFIGLAKMYKKNISILEFEKYVSLIVYGDDLVISVKHSIKDWFNGETLSTIFGNYGIRFTSFSNESTGISDIHDVVFLKRKFSRYEVDNKHYMLAPLEYKVVTETANWVHISENLLEATLETSEACVRNMFGHGEGTYERNRSRIMRALGPHIRQVSVRFPSWVAVFESNFSDDEYIPLVERAIAQMDQGAQGTEVSPIQVESSNVVLETQRVADLSGTTPVNNMFEYCAASEQTNFSNLCDRWFSFAHLRWGEQPRGTVLGSWTMPKDPVVEHVGKTSNFLPFSMWQYFKADMEIRAEVNSNKFQVGQLQLSFYYGGNEDINFKPLRENVYNASQRMHALISAGSSNPVHLKIPFKCPTAYVSCRSMNRYYTHDILSVGTLSCIVLNKLTVPSAVYNQVDVNIFITFKNIEFCGMRNVNNTLLAEAQIFGAIASGARLISNIAGAVSNVLDKECDKPIAPTPPTLLVPTAMNSLSYMAGVAEQHPTMRGIPLAQTPTITTGGQMDIDNIINTYGLVTHFDWNSSSGCGQVLATYPAHPILDLKCYQYFEKQASTVYHLPPVAVIASLFALWRGELEFRFDVIASAFHTGKLLIAYIPGAVMEDTVTLEQAKSSPNMVFDLSENRQCTLEVPYVSNKPFWPRGISLKHVVQERAPGVVKVFVLNSLIPMDSVAGVLEINMYMRGIPGKFEVAIPIAPAIGLSFNSHIQRNASTRTSTIYAPFYTTYYVYLNKTHLTLFYSSTAGKYVTFDNMKRGVVYSLQKVYQGSKAFDLKVPYFTPGGQMGYAQYMVRARVDWQSAVCLLFSNLGLAKRYAEQGGVEHAIPYFKDGGWAQVKSGSAWKEMPSGKAEFEVVTNVEVGISEASGPSADSGYDLRERAESQGDDVNPPTQILKSSRSTNFGLATFGENVTSLKSLGKRFNNYCGFSVRRSFVSIVPIVFDRLELDLSKHDNADNLYRDGTLPVVLSGFRFVRGGLRFKLLLTKSTPSSCNVVVMFDPEYKEVTRTVVTEPVSLSVNYPTIVQNTKVNEVLEFEIPYYRAGQYNYLQKPGVRVDDNMAEFSSLGALRIVTTSPDSFEVGLFYSLADDTMFDEFIGFPPMLTLNQVAGT